MGLISSSVWGLPGCTQLPSCWGSTELPSVPHSGRLTPKPFLGTAVFGGCRGSGTTLPHPPLWHPRLHSLSLTPSTLVALLITPVASQPLLGPLLPPAGLMASPVSQHLSGIQQAVPEARALSSDWAGVGMRATPPCAPLEKPAALTTHAPCGGDQGQAAKQLHRPGGLQLLRQWEAKE